MRTEWDVVVVGGAGTDYLAHGADLPSADHAVQGDRFLETPGGKGLNAAVAAARLGARVALVACIGTDEGGDRLLALLAAEEVDIRWIRRNGSAPTGVTLIHVAEDGRKQTLGVPGANARLSRADIEAAAPVITRAATLVVQLEPPMASVGHAVRLARSSGARVILDPAPPVPLPDELLAQVEVVKPNAGEARALTGVRVEDRASARRAAESLLGRGVGATAVEAGDGTLLSWRDGEHWLPRLSVRTVDTTGAGDAFAAGLAVALAEGRSLLEAGRFANAVAALATTRLGAAPAMPRRAEVLALLHQAGLPTG